MQINTSQILYQPSFKHKRPVTQRQNIFNKDISIRIFENKSLFKSRIFSEISVLISSGMDIKKSLEIISSGISKKKERQIIDNILNTIIKGSTLSKALEKTNFFSIYDYHSVRIGEESGSLSSVLKELAMFYSKRIAQQRQIRGALTYPILVLCTTAFSLVFMLNFIVPMFEDVFLRFHGGLPPITKAVIVLSHSFSRYALYLLIVLVVLINLHVFNKKKLWYRKLSSEILLKIPIAGSIIKLNYKTRFCQTLKLLIRSKVHLLEAVDLIKQMIGFFTMEFALEDIKKKLSRGVTFSKAMEDHSIFDKKLISMTRVAEEVNKLDVVYEQLFQQYSEELDTRIKTMNNLLEPVLIIFVGVLVAFILISMYMPIFQLGAGIY